MKIYLLHGFFIITIFCLNCQKDIRNEDTTIDTDVDPERTFLVKDGEYDSEFPTRPVTEHLSEISKSVHLISILAFYQSYHFDFEANIKKQDLDNPELKSLAAENIVFEQPASGTASLVYFDKDKIAFLTCAHIVDFPDTVIYYYQTDDNKDSDKVKSFIFKVRQTNNIIDQPLAYGFKILVTDEVTDIALVGKKIVGDNEFRLQNNMDLRFKKFPLVLTSTLGKADDLEFGTFVYIMGYPQSKKMVSTAIVSSPDYDSKRSFILDATLPKGISGGLVLAIRDGVPNFEIVGMTKAISGKTQFALVPERKTQFSEWETYKPYEGKIYLEKRDFSEPGMTFAVGMETILEFITNNEIKLRELGYNPDYFFKRIN